MSCLVLLNLSPPITIGIGLAQRPMDSEGTGLCAYYFIICLLCGCPLLLKIFEHKNLCGSKIRKVYFQLAIIIGARLVFPSSLPSNWILLVGRTKFLHFSLTVIFRLAASRFSSAIYRSRRRCISCFSSFLKISS